MQYHPLRIRTFLLNSLSYPFTWARNTAAINIQKNRSTTMQASEGKRLPLQPQLPSEVWITSKAYVDKKFDQRLPKQTSTTCRTKPARSSLIESLQTAIASLHPLPIDAFIRDFMVIEWSGCNLLNVSINGDAQDPLCSVRSKINTTILSDDASRQIASGRRFSWNLWPDQLNFAINADTQDPAVSARCKINATIVSNDASGRIAT